MAEDEAGQIVVIPEVRTGPLPITGSVSVNTPDALAAAADCGCPCDLGTPIEPDEET